MSTQVQYRRGTAAQNDAFTGALGEITVDTTNWTLRIHDGITVGGSGNLATVAYVTAQISSLSSNSISFGTSSVAVISSGGNVRTNVGGATITTVYSGGLEVTGVVSATGNVSGNYFIGNGSQLTGLSASKIYNGTSEANIGASGGNANITIGGTSNVAVFASTGLYVTGLISATSNVTAGNILTGGLISATGAITSANGITATANITGGNITTAGIMTSTGNAIHGNVLTSGLISATGNVQGGNLNATTNITVGGLTLNGNTITSSGSTLTIDPNGSGGVDGQVTIAGNLQVTGNVTYIDSNVVTTNDLVVNMANNAASAAAANGGGIGVGPAGSEYATWLYNSTQNNWTTSLGISATANITSGNILTGGLISATGNVTGGNINGGANVNATTHTGTTVSVTGNVTGGNLLTSGYISATGIISSAGNITGANYLTAGLISATGNITGGNLSVSTGTVTVGNIVNSNGNGVGNIGSSSLYYNTVFAKATSAQYADVAERYRSDADYPVGTVLMFGGSEEITQTKTTHDTAIAGTVSENPAYIMNTGLESKHVATVALLGRVPCRVIGTIHKGDLVASSEIPGVATTLDRSRYQPGCVIGKALENYNSTTEGIIEIVVGRL